MLKIVVGIDLGTSRIAWAFSTKEGAEGDIIVRIREGSLSSVRLSSVPGMKTETAVLLDSRSGNCLAFGHSAGDVCIDQTEDNEVNLDESGQAGNQVLKASSTMLLRWF